MIKIIAAVGKNFELGKNGDLIWNLPNDLKFFKSQTTGCPVVMGRNTFNSLPKRLPNRKHYILTDCLEFNKDVDGMMIYLDLKCLMKDVKELAKDQDIFIIGGASIYKLFVDYADEIILTEIEAEDLDADVYFPKFNKAAYDRFVIASNEDNGIRYTHVRYVKK